MLESSYWNRFLRRSLSRRRLLTGVALGTTGLAAAAVVGCSDDEETGTTGGGGGTYKDPGISDTEVKIGGTWPLTGPILQSTAIADSPKAYFEYINKTQNGVDGRKINYTFYDDQYSPPNTVERTRQLLDQDGVFALAAGLGTAQQNAVVPLVEQRGIPQLFISTTASIFLDAKKHPWTTTALSLAPYYGYGAVFGDYVNDEVKSAKVAVFYQNDDLGKDFLNGMKSTLKSPAAIVSEQTYEPTDTSVDVQVLAMKNSGANVMMSASVLRQHTLAIKSAASIGWKPQVLCSHAIISILAIKSQGLEQAYEGAIALNIGKDPFDPQWASDAALKDADKAINESGVNVDRRDGQWLTGQIWARAFAEALKRMKEPTRAGINEAVRSLKEFDGNGLLLPGITASGSKETNAMTTQGRLGRWNGARFELFGDVLKCPLPPIA